MSFLCQMGEQDVDFSPHHKSGNPNSSSTDQQSHHSHPLFDWVQEKVDVIITALHLRREMDILVSPKLLVTHPIFIVPLNDSNSGRVLFNLNELPFGVKFETPEKLILVRDGEYSVKIEEKGVISHIDIRIYRSPEDKKFMEEFEARFKTKQQREHAHRAATKIQSSYRRWVQRRRYKRLIHRTRVVKEIMSTEQTYVEEMKILIDVFIRSLKEAGIEANKLKVVFSEIEVLHGVHAQFFSKLQARVKKSYQTPIGDIFMEIPLHRSAYITYVNNYDTANKLLEEEMKKKGGVFSTTVNECTQDPRLKGKHLISFLILPIQRVPRYVMLIQDLLKNMKKGDSSDMEKLTEALAQIKDMAAEINNRKRDSESANAVLRVHKNLLPNSQKELNLVEPHRRFIHEGELWMLANKDIMKKRPVFIFLFNDILLITKEKSRSSRIASSSVQTPSNGRYKLVDKYKVSDCNVSQINSFHAEEEWFGFELVQKGEESKSVWFATTSQKDSSDWIEKLTMTIVPKPK